MKHVTKSVRYDVDLTRVYSVQEMQEIVKDVSKTLNVYISHIGSFSRKKYPNSVHWHFKEHPKEKGCLDATYWKEGREFWIIARNYEPEWVKEKALKMQVLLNKTL
ncbi:MAG: hypothetical protein AAF600_01405 [Bacteroidota bacterium]